MFYLELSAELSGVNSAVLKRVTPNGLELEYLSLGLHCKSLAVQPLTWVVYPGNTATLRT